MKCSDSHRIAPEGYPFIGIALVLALISAFIHFFLFVPFFALSIFVISFFRNPQRKIPAAENLLISPADGKIIFNGEVDEPRFLKRRVRKISIFMSPLNVHINRIPMSGTIKEIKYNTGKYFAAYAEKASLDNEQNAIVIENAKGQQVLFIQIAGFIARRIVCYAKPGESWKKGSIYGLIRFGSRVDVYFPLDAQVRVSLGEHVKNGSTVLAEMHS